MYALQLLSAPCPDEIRGSSTERGTRTQRPKSLNPNFVTLANFEFWTRFLESRIRKVPNSNPDYRCLESMGNGQVESFFKNTTHMFRICPLVFRMFPFFLKPGLGTMPPLTPQGCGALGATENLKNVHKHKGKLHNQPRGSCMYGAFSNETHVCCMF